MAKRLIFINTLPVAESVHALGDEIRYLYRAFTVTYFVFFEKNVNTTNAKTEEFEQIATGFVLRRIGPDCRGVRKVGAT
jgi:hypothetical protein